MNHSMKQTVWRRPGDHPKVWEDYESSCGGDTPNGHFYLGSSEDYVEVLPGDTIHDMDDGTALVSGPMTKRSGYGARPWYNTDSKPRSQRTEMIQQTATTPVGRTITQQIDSLHQDIDNIRKDLGTLEGRLDPILTPAYPVESSGRVGTDDGPAGEPVSPLANTLDKFGVELRAIRRRIGDLTDRAEV